MAVCTVSTTILTSLMCGRPHMIYLSCRVLSWLDSPRANPAAVSCNKCVCGHIPLSQAAKIDHTGLIRPLAVQVNWSMLAEGIKQ